MGYNTDGNLAALNSYLAEQDALDAADDFLASEQESLACDLFDAYMTNNQAAIDEVDDYLKDKGSVFDRLREAYTLGKTIAERKELTAKAYMKAVEGVCEFIVENMDHDDINMFRIDMGL